MADVLPNVEGAAGEKLQALPVIFVSTDGITYDLSALVAAGSAPDTGTITSVNDTGTSTTILAANTSRKGATFYNDSTAILYLALSNVTASASVFSVKVQPQGFYELALSQGGVYTGIVVGIWASDASGAVRVTEFV